MKSLIDFDAWTLEKAGPHAYIQWKGTDACMDFECKCGASGHIDADFLYRVRCEACGVVYQVGCHVPLFEVTNPLDLAEIEKRDMAHPFADEPIAKGDHWTGWGEILAYLSECYERDKASLEPERAGLIWRFLRRNHRGDSK